MPSPLPSWPPLPLPVICPHSIQVPHSPPIGGSPRVERASAPSPAVAITAHGPRFLVHGGLIPPLQVTASSPLGPSSTATSSSRCPWARSTGCTSCDGAQGREVPRCYGAQGLAVGDPPMGGGAPPPYLLFSCRPLLYSLPFLTSLSRLFPALTPSAFPFPFLPLSLLLAFPPCPYSPLL